jgi:hypothetical protein
MKYVWIRRGYGCFVRCKSVAKAIAKAEHWRVFRQGDKGGENVAGHDVIGLFTNTVNQLQGAKRKQLYP